MVYVVRVTSAYSYTSPWSRGCHCKRGSLYLAFSAPSTDVSLCPPLGPVFIALVISVNYGSAVWGLAIAAKAQLWEKRANGGE